MKLGLGPGNSLLAGLSLLMIPPLYVSLLDFWRTISGRIPLTMPTRLARQFIMKYGKKLRARSKYTSAMETPVPTMEVTETV